MEINKPIGKWILSLHKHNKKYISQKLKKYNLNRNESSILIYLYNNGDGINQEELAWEMGVDKSTISRAIKELIKNNFISKRRSLDDGRVFLIYLTERSMSVKQEIKDAYYNWFSLIMEGISKEEINIILKNLEMIFNKIKYLE
ncbi:MarR family winged helix-turn-helix transcriptional regulator [Orenia marismortui]|uniref:HTH-type transcriptional regulator SarZ n=1 Tax=Orenia marismortui TaxID=46469 RepID=A0A4R8GZ76_9FIRM|nr:MarR family transcriptional regulator [Orenia marismortui]TDX51951.1 DNA-binding MarR family transcriptional regulator [Orenia marismortui]